MPTPRVVVAPVRKFGALMISSVKGVQVFLDGTSMGVTDDQVGGMLIEALLVGGHTLDAWAEGFVAQQVPVTIFEAATAYVSVQLTEAAQQLKSAPIIAMPRTVGTLEIIAAPAGLAGEVWINGARLEGRLPLTVSGVPTGHIRIEVRRPDATVSTELDLIEGQTLRLVARWADRRLVPLGVSFVPNEAADGATPSAVHR